MKIRVANKGDAQGLWRLRNAALRYGCVQVYDEPTLKAFTPDIMPEGMNKTIAENQVFIIDSSNGKNPVACGYLDLVTGHVEAVFTQPEYQGKGLAAAIIEQIKQQARSLNIRQLTLSSTPNAVGFYLRQGFSVVAKGKYFSHSTGTYLDCVEMIWLDNA
ncbi:GNAT family N-acetyltransferase [Rouxiella badensis]|uniref:GNAT family N-acetyltransferase n=1 Tax=Rouxiella badensis TaxID=1646377 RepID=UPI001D148E01|nr:GNAT family N-acetyltransferase [Rouxiella badensis]MCC3717060.1 GNAT family N-acetyltransferase [Rouxiella badensis]MCC3728168.1 GNAT family N-acetyltransferase [Rouxiella badensis]MCC3732072.1 GNAT family N-acetyltransferase [Rouxiella badensis]MCC3739912.1 GNAT family N-acetyltransferase [Rouxiella badensis]MCC3758953.1 GNAT family N-acetyltransferase [Rouxiella badensis]